MYKNHKVELFGHVGRDVNVAQTPDGKPVCNFSIGVNTGNSKTDSTMWVKVALWEPSDKLLPLITPGKFVFIEGTLRHDQRGNPGYTLGETRDGKKAVFTTFQVDTRAVKLLGDPAGSDKPTASNEIDDDVFNQLQANEVDAPF